MEGEKETKEKLLKSAKAEFMEKGYAAASLRSICKNAGVTTGALYFFFKDKEDLFESLVKEPFQNILSMMEEHYNSEAEQIEENEDYAVPEDIETSDDFTSSVNAIKFLYAHYDEMTLLIAKSQGSKFSNCLDELVRITEKHYARLSEIICKKKNMPNVDERVIHWISHVQIEAFAYLLTHVDSEEKAEKILPHIMKYLTGGWYKLYDFI